MNFSRAFDTIYNYILLKTLQFYRFNGKYEFIKCYSTNRNQFVIYNKKSKKVISLGKFIKIDIWTFNDNNIDVSETLSCLQFEDDTTIFSCE